MKKITFTDYLRAEQARLAAIIHDISKMEADIASGLDSEYRTIEFDKAIKKYAEIGKCLEIIEKLG